MQTITAEAEVAATTNDVLGATPLRSMPGPGALAVYGASDQQDSRATVVLGGRVLRTDSRIVKVSATRQIDVNADVPLGAIQVRGGEVLTVDVTEVTPAQGIRVLALWIGEVA